MLPVMGKSNFCAGGRMRCSRSLVKPFSVFTAVWIISGLVEDRGSRRLGFSVMPRPSTAEDTRETAFSTRFSASNAKKWSRRRSSCGTAQL